jgi:hypothetical protein
MGLWAGNIQYISSIGPLPSVPPSPHGLYSFQYWSLLCTLFRQLSSSCTLSSNSKNRHNFSASFFGICNRSTSSGRLLLLTCRVICMFVIPEMEFLDINLKKDLSLLLHSVHSLSTGRFLKKTRLYSGNKNTYKKICETRKIKSIHEDRFVERIMRVNNQTKTRV